MKKYLLAISILLLASIIFLGKPASAQAPLPLPAEGEKIEFRSLDRRSQILRSYLAKYNSPMQNNAADFVEAADKYNLDWKLVVSIAGVESTFGRFVPGGTDPSYSSFNAWGWGVYGTQAIYFKSWKDGIYTVSEGLRKNYFDKGLTNPYDINRIYAASPTWGSKVSYFLQNLESFKTEYEKVLANKPQPELGRLEMAGTSAALASIPE